MEKRLSGGMQRGDEQVLRDARRVAQIDDSEEVPRSAADLASRIFTTARARF